MSSHDSFNMNDFERPVQNMLTDLGITLDDEINDAIDKVGKQTVESLKATSPKGKGKYARSWKFKKTQTERGRHKVVVYNTNYQLTHLLEYGHATRTGGRTKAEPHIKPAEDAAADALDAQIKIIVGKNR